MKIIIANLVVDNALCEEIAEIVAISCQFLFSQIQLHMIFLFYCFCRSVN